MTGENRYYSMGNLLGVSEMANLGQGYNSLIIMQIECILSGT